MLEGLLGPRDDADLADGQAAPHVGEETTGKTGTRPWSDNGDLVGGPPGAAWRMIVLNADGPAASEVPMMPPTGRELILRAWLAPLLAGSVTHRAGDARDNLERWLQFVAEPDLARAHSNPYLLHEVADLSRPLEVALAQGFKYAANRRQRYPQAQPEVRAYLLKQATEMLRGSRFWFSQLTLLHALCLLSLPDPDGAKPAGRLRTDHSTVVGRWAAMLRSPQHPFVIEAQRLVTWALDTGVPERFIWIDERDVAARVGSYPAHLTSTRRRNLWIPPSTGWAVLHPRAQKLLADVLLLLNLAERGEQTIGYTMRLRRIDRNRLPPCLTRDRRTLRPESTDADRYYTPGGAYCQAGCPFGLCPYPPKREAISRTELSESFCLRQQTLTKSKLDPRRTAPWQKTTPAQIRQFWQQMVRRARA